MQVQGLPKFFQIENKFQRDEILKLVYHEFLSEYEALGHMKFLHMIQQTVIMITSFAT